MKVTSRAHAITREGKKVLIEAEGPGTNFIERFIARRNHKRWNAERAHLLEN
jgi:hypothetical protein